MHIWLKDEDREELLRDLKSSVVQTLVMPLVTVLGIAALVGVLVQLSGEPGAEFAVILVRDAALPVAVVQAHMLAAVFLVGAVCYLLGRDQIKVLAHCLGALIGPNIPGLKFLQMAIWGHGFTPICQPNAPILRSIRSTLPVSTAPRHIFGLSPQLE